MFDMPKHTGSDAGYQFRISYNREQNFYTVTGHIIRMSPHSITSYNMDGGVLAFRSLQEAIDHIVNYKETK